MFDFTIEAELCALYSTDLDSFKSSNNTPARPNWQSGDRMSVVNLSSGKVLGGVLIADQSGTTSSFSGTLKGTVRSGDKLAFLFPSQEYVDEADYSPVFVDFSKQEGGSIDKAPLSAYGVYVADSVSFSEARASFKNLMSYMQMNLTGLAVNSSVETIVIDNIGAGARLEITEDGFTSSPISGTISLSLTKDNEKTTSDGNKAIYFSFPGSAPVSSRMITVRMPESMKHSIWSGVELGQGISYNTTLSQFTEIYVPFEDTNFKKYCIDNYDLNNDGEISLAEAHQIERIVIDSRGIFSLKGIEFFSELTYLDCHANQLRNLDVSHNYALTDMVCYSNQIETLDVSSNLALMVLDCSPMLTLNKLIMLDNQFIPGINKDRNPSLIPEMTVIEYKELRCALDSDQRYFIRYKTSDGKAIDNLHRKGYFISDAETGDWGYSYSAGELWAHSGYLGTEYKDGWGYWYFENNITYIPEGGLSSNPTLVYVEIPDGVIEIRRGAFADCTNLRSVSIPGSVEEIDGDVFSSSRVGMVGKYGAFYNCKKLSHVSLPDGLKTVGGGAFKGCESLTSVVFPDSVKEIQASAFYDCTNLATVALPLNLQEIAVKLFKGCVSLSDCVIPDGVKDIKIEAFLGCTMLESVTLPSSLVTIGDCAFEGASHLEEIICYATTAPRIDARTFMDIKENGTLYYPKGSDYTSWLSKKSHYLGASGWNGKATLTPR